MDKTSWKPKVFKATESVDYKVNEVNIERGGNSMKIDGKSVIKIWESFSGWYWYAIEDQGSYTGIDADGNEVQAHAWYGYVQGMENEWGTWDSNELERVGVWTVPKSNWGWTGKESKANEDWKDVANKFYNEELNKGKKSGGESYFVEWGYDLDYDFAEIDDIDEAKQKAEAEGGNVYLNDQLVYSVIPSIKKDPTNDKSNFIMGNHVMDVESLARDNGGEGYANIDDDGFYNPIGISDVPSIIGGIAKGYGKKLIKPFQEDKSGDWEIQVKDDNGGWKTYEYGGHYFGKDGADFDARNLPWENRVVRKGSGYESKASEGFNQGLYGYVDAKCKTCGVEFDSIPDMDDHYAMHSDHVSNLDDLDSDIPNSD